MYRGVVFVIAVAVRDGAEILLDLQEGIEDVGIEMRAVPLPHDADCLFVA